MGSANGPSPPSSSNCVTGGRRTREFGSHRVRHEASPLSSSRLLTNWTLKCEATVVGQRVATQPGKQRMAFLSDYPTPQAAAPLGLGRMAAFLRRHSYGTRLAPEAWTAGAGHLLARAGDEIASRRGPAQA